MNTETYLQLNCRGSLEVINTQRKSVQNLQLRNPKEDSNTKLWTAEGYRHNERHEIVVDHGRWSTRLKSRADSGMNQRKVEFFFEKGTQHKNVAHKNENDCGSECRSTQFWCGLGFESTQKWNSF